METKIKKLKLTDLVKDEKINHLDVDQLADVQGGFALMDGCYTKICATSRSTGVEFCDGGAVCTWGIGG